MIACSHLHKTMNKQTRRNHMSGTSKLEGITWVACVALANDHDVIRGRPVIFHGIFAGVEHDAGTIGPRQKHRHVNTNAAANKPGSAHFPHHGRKSTRLEPCIVTARTTADVLCITNLKQKHGNPSNAVYLPSQGRWYEATPKSIGQWTQILQFRLWARKMGGLK